MPAIIIAQPRYEPWWLLGLKFTMTFVAWVHLSNFPCSFSPTIITNLTIITKNLKWDYMLRYLDVFSLLTKTITLQNYISFLLHPNQKCQEVCKFTNLPKPNQGVSQSLLVCDVAKFTRSCTVHKIVYPYESATKGRNYGHKVHLLANFAKLWLLFSLNSKIHKLKKNATQVCEFFISPKVQSNKEREERRKERREWFKCQQVH